MDPLSAALGILSVIEAGYDLVNKIKNNAAATGNRELTEDERQQLDARIKSLAERAHWKPSS